MDTVRTALRSPITHGSLLAVLLVTVLVGWLLAAPPGASPDDPYHMASIWCADGYKDQVCVEDPGAPDRTRVLVPQPVPGLSCFQNRPTESAICSLKNLDAGMQRLVPAPSNIRGERPNLYYRAMHVFVGEDVGRTAALVRTSNLALLAALIIATGWVAERRLRAAFLLSSLVVSVPLGLFLVTSVNTHAWGLAGLTTLWANGVTAISHERLRNRLVATALGVAGLILGLGSRTEAVAHVAVIAAALSVLWYFGLRTSSGAGAAGSARSSRRNAAWRGAALLLIAVVAIVIVRAAPQNAGLDRVIRDLQRGYGRLDARGIGDPFLAIAFEVPSLWTGALGHIWGLGALDIPIPTLASLPVIIAFIVLMTLGMQSSARARILSAAIVVFALFVFPAFSLMKSGLIVFEELQPRQFMVMLFVLLGIGLLRIRREPALIIPRGTRVVLTTALAAGHSIALLVTMRRHISGLAEFRYVSFSSEIEWWWASAPGPNTVWAVASFAYLVATVMVFQLFRDETSGSASTTERSAAPA